MKRIVKWFRAEALGPVYQPHPRDQPARPAGAWRSEFGVAKEDGRLAIESGQWTHFKVNAVYGEEPPA